MRYRTFFMLAALIILAGLVYYLATPKWTFDQNGQIKKNVYTGKVERTGMLHFR